MKELTKEEYLKKLDPKDPKKFKCRDNPPVVSVLDEATKSSKVSSTPVDNSPRRYSF